LLLFVLTEIIHHNIILKEELFLEKRFGERWLEYKQRTPRYLGFRTPRMKA
jgi:protein-S-isoprenylcysteine O-methyltransferase Ste14